MGFKKITKEEAKLYEEEMEKLNKELERIKDEKIRKIFTNAHLYGMHKKEEELTEDEKYLNEIIIMMAQLSPGAQKLLYRLINNPQKKQVL